MNAVSQLLTELSVDPFRLDDFMSDPDPFLAEAGIALEELPRLRRPGETLSDDTDGTWVRCAACADPGYDPLPDPEVPEPDMPETGTPTETEPPAP